jgi:hypothetical protein
MNYLLILIGYKPEYIKYTINAILSTDMDAEIYLCSDINVNYKNTTYINLQDVHSEYIETINDLSIYENTIFKKNPLWSTSLKRVFYIYELKKLLGLNKVVHFDNDVIIYKSYSEIENCFVKNTLNITQSNSKKIIFGYSYIENNNLLKQVCDLVLETCLSGNKSNWEENNFKPFNEMQILGSVNSNNPLLFNLLPTIPYEAQKKSNNIIFDPAGYGQFLDGTHNEPKKNLRKGFYDINDFIGTELIAKRIKVSFKQFPKVEWEKQIFELANLHVHSKRLSKFLPSNYKNFI